MRAYPQGQVHVQAWTSFEVSGLILQVGEANDRQDSPTKSFERLPWGEHSRKRLFR
jgi:hypothetical protein